QVVGQLFDYKVGHGRFTCWVKRHIASKSLISMENQQNLDHQVTDPGWVVCLSFYWPYIGPAPG
ncbi:hypothetical protein, partial [Acidovorax sp.]|uniref:hypothetical protein n=1 Tax=Acidovorax sp. TaxID=1872122 RepID=UPI00391F1D69